VTRRSLALAGALVLAACGGTASPVPSGTPRETLGPLITQEPPTDAPPTVAPSDDLVTGLAKGPWRRKPVAAPPSFWSAAAASCRVGNDFLDDLQPVVVDVRGEERLTIVYAGAAGAAVCWTGIGSLAGSAALMRLEVPATAADGIDVRYYGPPPGETSSTLAIGRLGPMSQPANVLGDQNVASVIAGFDDETFVWAAFANSWYAMWWPSTDPTDGIATVNGRNEVLATAPTSAAP
jgi:hypothetical protein